MLPTFYYIVKDANATSYLHKDKTFYCGVFTNVLSYKTQQGAVKKLKKLSSTYGIKELFPELRVRGCDSQGNVTVITLDDIK
jgi:hypothetical protein